VGVVAAAQATGVFFSPAYTLIDTGRRVVCVSPLRHLRVRLADGDAVYKQA